MSGIEERPGYPVLDRDTPFIGLTQQRDAANSFGLDSPFGFGMIARGRLSTIDLHSGRRVRTGCPLGDVRPANRTAIRIGSRVSSRERARPKTGADIAQRAPGPHLT